MPNSDLHVPKLSLAYAKIVATPTPFSWSQVYNAGSLFVALSLTITDQNKQDLVLPSIGKDLFNNLEAEFFTLEDKKLQTIKTAIEKSINLPPDIVADACIAYFKDNILYLFVVGKGKIIMKRTELLGLLLEKKVSGPQPATASGYLQPHDTIMLQTDHFTKCVSEEKINEALKLELPNDIAESLSPHVHEKEDGSQAAIIITYNGAPKTQVVNDEITMPSTQHPILPEPAANQNVPSTFLKLQKKLKLQIPRLSRLQKISLIVAVLILILLTTSIIFTKSKQENEKYEALYQQVYPQAQKNYEEGKALKKLNQILAHDDFVKAEQILKDNMNKFKSGSKEQVNLQALLIQVQTELNTATNVKKISPIAVNADASDLLNIEKNNKAVDYAQDDAAIYLLTGKAVTTIDKSNDEKKDIIENNNDWSSPVALSLYQGNIYILDKKAGVLKYVVAQTGFNKTAYFKENPPVLTNARSMSIDGSIWILTSDGKILKYTSGQPENFAISGLLTPLANPTRIFTNIDIDNIYILDNGNSRIVKLGKSGSYQNQYNADIIQSAKNFEILESDQKALVLSDNKIYELPL